ncbi:MAG: response regulator [Thermomicrobiales bacterium]
MSGSGKIRVLIVDDVHEARDNVAKLLRFEPGVEIVGMADGGQEGIDLAFQLEPDIVLMDINMPEMDGIAATTLISGRLPNTSVIMMSVQNEPDYLRRSMLAGAREFLSKPFSLEELAESIRHVNQLSQANRRVVVSGVDPNLPVPGGRKRRAKIISVYGLKGGVGRSTIAANLAVALRQQGDREVALLDGNLIYGDIGVMLNVTENKTIADVVRNFQTLDRDLVTDILVPHNSGVRVLLAPPDPQVGEQVRADHMELVLQHMLTMVDYIVVDTRPSFDEVTLSLLDHSDQIVLVLTLELTAIKGAKKYLEVGDLLGYDSDKISLVVNKATAPAGIAVTDVEATLKRPVIAKLSDDPALTLKAINEGVPFMQSAPLAPLSQEIGQLAMALTGGQVAVTEVGAKAGANGSAGPSTSVRRWMKPVSKLKVG